MNKLIKLGWMKTRSFRSIAIICILISSIYSLSIIKINQNSFSSILNFISLGFFIAIILIVVVGSIVSFMEDFEDSSGILLQLPKPGKSIIFSKLIIFIGNIVIIYLTTQIFGNLLKLVNEDAFYNSAFSFFTIDLNMLSTEMSPTGFTLLRLIGLLFSLSYYFSLVGLSILLVKRNNKEIPAIKWLIVLLILLIINIGVLIIVKETLPLKLTIMDKSKFSDHMPNARELSMIQTPFSINDNIMKYDYDSINQVIQLIKVEIFPIPVILISAFIAFCIYYCGKLLDEKIDF